MRTRLVRNPAAAKTLISLLPLLAVKASDDVPTTDFDNDVRITWLVRRAIEAESLEVILCAPDADRVMIARRIHGQVERYRDHYGKRPGWYLLPSHFAANKHTLLGITEGRITKYRLPRTRTDRHPLWGRLDLHGTGQ